jgi:hypothetical protein
MAYRYEAFFSYKRDPRSDAWHQRLKDLIEYFVGNELGISASIFLDTEDIQTGERWRNKLGGSLRASKCIICVWSPRYFQSQWCLSEWKTFAKREVQFETDLVVPLRYHDGESFPNDARAKQITDCTSYTSTLPRFWDTDNAVEFEKAVIKPFSIALANHIRKAPPAEEFELIEADADEVSPEQTIGRPGNT